MSYESYKFGLWVVGPKTWCHMNMSKFGSWPMSSGQWTLKQKYEWWCYDHHPRCICQLLKELVDMAWWQPYFRGLSFQQNHKIITSWKLKDSRNKRLIKTCKGTKTKNYHNAYYHFSKIYLLPCKGIEIMWKFIVNTSSQPWGNEDPTYLQRLDFKNFKLVNQC
jgi:hypothetical protein